MRCSNKHHRRENLTLCKELWRRSTSYSPGGGKTSKAESGSTLLLGVENLEQVYACTGGGGENKDVAFMSLATSKSIDLPVTREQPPFSLLGTPWIAATVFTTFLTYLVLTSSQLQLSLIVYGSLFRNGRLQSVLLFEHGNYHNVPYFRGKAL
ncbi:hypothetical protein J6590_059450 [Homalodisca vitripennis]|nr:hypothetical protein J6590_059450 [Homalodisca vitripennis]